MVTAAFLVTLYRELNRECSTRVTIRRGSLDAAVTFACKWLAKSRASTRHLGASFDRWSVAQKGENGLARILATGTYVDGAEWLPPLAGSGGKRHPNNPMRNELPERKIKPRTERIPDQRKANKSTGAKGREASKRDPWARDSSATSGSSPRLGTARIPGSVTTSGTTLKDRLAAMVAEARAEKNRA